jgi:hypothetical protein
MRVASGLKWFEVGGVRPNFGTELRNTRGRALLAEALEQQTTFTQVEWDAFGIQGLTPHNFILSGGRYYKPDVQVYNPPPSRHDLV